MGKMATKIISLFIVITLAVAGIAQAAGQLCPAGCDQCRKTVEASCCSKEHDQEQGKAHTAREISACCHFELFPDERQSFARTGTAQPVDQSVFISSATVHEDVLPVSELSGNLPLRQLPNKVPIPIYLVKCAFLI